LSGTQSIRSEPLEKRQFLNYLLQNSQIKDGQLVLDYKKPFDFIAHFAKQNREQKRKNTTKSDVHSVWLLLLNELRTVDWKGNTKRT